jgi:cell division protein FtsW (lipid II flippase)
MLFVYVAGQITDQKTVWLAKRSTDFVDETDGVGEKLGVFGGNVIFWRFGALVGCLRGGTG